MEPRVFTRGNRRIPRSSQVESSLLQWSNASSRVETQVLVTCSLGVFEASMEPRVFTRGNKPARVRGGWKVLWLQWSHASSRVETRNSPRFPYRIFTSFNGATRLHAWKLVLTRLGGSEDPRFNGATRLHA